MASLDLLPSTVYCPPPKPVLAHRRENSLNTIMEDEEVHTDNVDAASARNFASWTSPMSDHFPTPRGNHFMPAPRLTEWSSPLSDNFPTPRGNHFMPAPHLPSEPNSATDSEYSQASVPWTRDSFGTQATDFDELYDVSDDEKEYRRRSALVRSSAVRKNTATKRMSGGSLADRNSLPSLVIPPSPGWAPASIKSFTSPIPPTPPPKVPMSPAIFSYLASQDLLSSSATPSLDGSLSSEQMAQMSAPPTPNIGNDDGADGDGWGGVRLQPGAMATLHALAGGDDPYDEQVEQVIEISQTSPTREMQQSPPPTVSSIRRHHSVVLPPHQQRSLDTLSMLDIPSPGGFFSNLSEDSQSMWGFEPIFQDSEVPPSSSTAEHFYKTPWNAPIESIVATPENLSDICSTARPAFSHQASDETIIAVASPLSTSTHDDIVATEILAKYDYDEGYRQQLVETAAEHFDRTSLWLTAQTTYVAALINPPEARDDEAALEKRDAEAAERAIQRESSPLVKAVRFSDFITTETKAAVGARRPGFCRQESAYYRSFLNFVTNSRHRDAFVHCLPRYEALQTQRIVFPEAHRAQLLGKYQLSVVPQSAKKRMSANVARGDENPMEDFTRVKADKEAEALAQMSGANWNVMATKMLNGGRLIAQPVAKKFAHLTSMGPKSTGSMRGRARILDLGGQAACDWAWHVAFAYPNVKVYTLTTKATRHTANSNIKGPRNHRQVAVDKLTKLPFADNHFDLISARNLYSILKIASENGEDEYDTCLKECMRVLKPGGYLEFNILDSDIVNAGPRGEAKSVEFGFSLKTRGFDPSPSKSWISRLHKAGFVSVKRAWTFLPMGAPLAAKPNSTSHDGQATITTLEAMVTGSTESAALITGIVGAWAWEKWMLKLQMEMGLAEASLLEGNWGILEEGRKAGSGWRALCGWARKPL